MTSFQTAIEQYPDNPLLEQFTLGYLLGLAFTGSIMSDDPDASCNEPIFSNPGGDIAEVVDPETDVWDKLPEHDQLQVITDCNDFLLQCAQQQIDLSDRAHEAGSDFHLTRNGHGAGFWDGDWDDIGKQLTELSRPYGTCELVQYGEDSEFFELQG